MSITPESIRVVSQTLSQTARILARQCAPEDRDAALLFADVLRRRPTACLRLGEKLAQRPAGRRERKPAA